MKQEQKIKKIVVDEFSSEKAAERYRKAGLAGLEAAEKVMIKKFFKGKTVLDLGCGAGRTSIPLVKMGYKVTAIDITPLMIKNAKINAKIKKANVKFIIGDATNLKQFKNNSFDNAIFSYNGWTQIPGKTNRMRCLKEVHRVLKHDHYFILTAHKRKIGKFGKYIPLWSFQTIKHFILKPLKFKIDELDYGDRFFSKERSGGAVYKKQYIHIPSLKEMFKVIKEAGFELVFYGSRKEISIKESVVKGGNYIFYICRKP